MKPSVQLLLIDDVAAGVVLTEALRDLGGAVLLHHRRQA